MKVSELISLLENFDGDKEIFVDYDDELLYIDDVSDEDEEIVIYLMENDEEDDYDEEE